MPFIRKIGELKKAGPMDFLERKFLVGKKVMFGTYRFEPGGDFPIHTHDAEQVTYILKGPWYFKLGKEGKLLKVETGTVAFFEPGFPHGGKSAGTEAIAIDTWSPILEKDSLQEIKQATIIDYSKEKY